MSEPIWNKFLTERDKAVFGTSGYAARQGFGKRPALLIIDVNYAFCDERPMPILESIKRWRNSCGEDAWVAMPYLKSLIEKARDKGIPVIYTTGVRRADNWDNGSWSWKNNRSSEDRSNRAGTNIDGNEIVAEIAPGPKDIVIYKQKPSGFFGTNMTSYLTLLGCDSVIVTGTTTSGCVRATVLDAFSLNYRITLAEEGCFDRSQASHAINLCDMNAKYADVVKTSEVLEFFDTLPANQYDLPSGAPHAGPPGKQRRLTALRRRSPVRLRRRCSPAARASSWRASMVGFMCVIMMRLARSAARFSLQRGEAGVAGQAARVVVALDDEEIGAVGDRDQRVGPFGVAGIGERSCRLRSAAPRSMARRTDGSPRRSAPRSPAPRPARRA